MVGELCCLNEVRSIEVSLGQVVDICVWSCQGTCEHRSPRAVASQ